ncbi:hypothetical protein AB0I82_09280 [Streptomyces sp. NPDC050315]|uniref:hypothetical protein n=1 Tax=Streptomyces sp. NPDC050315 TaxID=3155039 RepID=UPI003438C7EB
MSDLIVDYDELQAIKKNFGTLQREFDSCASNQDSMAEAYGDHSIKSAMEEFADSWDEYRKDLMKQMGDVEKRVKTAIKSFKEADGEKDGGSHG